MDVCRFCLEGPGENEENDLFYPCRCKAPVHRHCLNHWRTEGLNSANLTRCEVCHYHYRLEKGTRTWQIHLLFYAVAVAQIILFFLLSLATGQLIRATNIVEVVDWGRLSFMKPDTSKGWFFMGVCFNSFIFGCVVTLYLLVLLVTGRLRKRAQQTRQRRSIQSEWWSTARQSRQRSRDCCRDCCHSSSESDAMCLYCYLIGPDCYCYTCEACCGSCDAQCTECCSCIGDGGCCAGDLPACEGCVGGDDNPCLVIVFGIAVVLAFVLLLLGMLVMFWTVVVNVLYGVWLNQNYLREHVANRYNVLEYNSQYDTDPAKDPTGTPSETNAAKYKERSADTKEGKVAAPQQEAMATKPEVIGKGASLAAHETLEPELALGDDLNFGGTLVSIDLTGESPIANERNLQRHAL